MLNRAFDEERFESLGGTPARLSQLHIQEPRISRIRSKTLMALSGSVRRYQSPARQSRRARCSSIRAGARTPSSSFWPPTHRPGRLLKSQLKFHYSGDLPVYSTSSIYCHGRAFELSDLNGVMFADTPWIIAPQRLDRTEDLPPCTTNTGPQSAGSAAFMRWATTPISLVGSLFAARTGDHMLSKLDGATGELFSDDEGRVHRRKLAWAQFQSGVKPLPLPDPNPSVDRLQRHQRRC